MAKQRRSEGLGDWIASLRFSGFTVLIIGLVVIGGLVVSPTLSTYVQQQRELAELRESVRQQRERVDQADEARAKWLDPSYVRSQARGRLFYVMPGEIQLSVIDDVVIAEDNPEKTIDRLTSLESDWARSLVASTLVAGTTNATPEELRGKSGAGGATGAAGAETPAEPDPDAPAAPFVSPE